MNTKTRNVIVGLSYIGTIIVSYIGLMLYNSEYQAIDNSYIIVFCILEALFLRIAIGPIIIPMNSSPRTSILGTSKNLLGSQQKNLLDQRINEKKVSKILNKTANKNTFSELNSNNKNPTYLVSPKGLTSHLQANSKAKILTSTIDTVTCSNCKAQIPNKTNDTIYCPFCNTVFIKSSEKQLKENNTQKESITNKSLLQSSPETISKQTTKEVFHNEILLANTSGSKHIDNTGSGDTLKENIKEQLHSEIEKRVVDSNQDIEVLTPVSNSELKKNSLYSSVVEKNYNEQQLLDNLNLVKERLEQKRREIEQNGKKNINRITLDTTNAIKQTTLEQNPNRNIDIQCAICKNDLHLDITKQNSSTIITFNHEQFPLYQIPNGYSLLIKHANQSSEELHQIFLTLNKDLKVLSQEVTIFPNKVQNIQKITKENDHNSKEAFLASLKYPCRLCKEEFSIGDQYITTKYESTNHTEIIHIRTSHQTANQNEKHEALIKIDLSQKILLNMPEINLISAKSGQYDDNTVVLITS